MSTSTPSARTAGVGSWLRFANLPVAIKVAAVVMFGLLTTMAVGGVGHRELSRTDRQIDAIVVQQANPAIALGSTRESFARVRSRLAQAAAYDQQKDIDSALKKLNSYEQAVRDGLNSYATSPLTAKERAVINDNLQPTSRRPYDRRLPALSPWLTTP
jgi:hypothetical protein